MPLLHFDAEDAFEGSGADATMDAAKRVLAGGLVSDIVEFSEDVVSPSELASAQEEHDFIRAVVAGLADIETGKVSSLDDVKRDLDIN